MRSRSQVNASRSCDHPLATLSILTCHAKIPRRSFFAGFFLGGVGFADTCKASQNDVFATTEFALTWGYDGHIEFEYQGNHRRHMSLVVTLAAMFGKPVADRLAKGLLERKNGAQKFEQATAAMAQGLTAIDALKNTFGKEFFLVLNEAIGLSAKASFTYEASTQGYIRLEEKDTDPIRLLRDEFNINLDRLSVMNLRKSDVRNQFLGMLFIWQERCREYLGVECYNDIDTACDSIRGLVRGEVSNYKKVRRFIFSVVLGGVGVVMILSGVSTAVGRGIGAKQTIYRFIDGVPWPMVGVLTIPGVLLVMFSILSKNQDDEITQATSIAYDLLGKVSSVKKFN